MIEDTRSEHVHVDQPSVHWTQTSQSTNDFLTKNCEENSSKNLSSARIFPVIEGIPSKKTQISYQRCFNHFLDRIKIHDLQVLLDFSQKVIKQMIVDYILYLRDERKLSRATIIINLSAILHFFQINNDEFTLTLRNFRIHLPSDESIKEDRPYTIEEIRQVYNECDLRSRSIILLLCSSGMRMGALHSLQIGHVHQLDHGSKCNCLCWNKG
jgi:integrase